jgi:hypothetical protein
LKGTPWYGEISIVDFQVQLSINESATFAACALGHVTDHLGKKLVVEITPAVVKGYQTSRLAEKARRKPAVDRRIVDSVGPLLR